MRPMRMTLLGVAVLGAAGVGAGAVRSMQARASGAETGEALAQQAEQIAVWRSPG